MCNFENGKCTVCGVPKPSLSIPNFKSGGIIIPNMDLALIDNSYVLTPKTLAGQLRGIKANTIFIDDTLGMDSDKLIKEMKKVIDRNVEIRKR